MDDMSKIFFGKKKKPLESAKRICFVWRTLEFMFCGTVMQH